MIYVIMSGDKYLVETPYWNVGVWTHDINLAAVHDDDQEFFKTHYPSFKIVEVDESFLKAYEKRRKQKRKEYRARLKERRAERDKRLGIKINYGDEE